MKLRSIDLSLAGRLKDREFRREWFRAELEDTVPDMFRALREERGFTQSDLAEKTGMKQSAISRFERDRGAKWNFETLLRLAEALDAQLMISVIKAEDVIAKYEREESGRGPKGGSVLEASGEERFNEDKSKSPLFKMPPKKEEKRESVLGASRWN